jgi:hypothetical protein
MKCIYDRVLITGTKYDLRIKLTAEQKREIKILGAGYGIHALAKKYGVSRRLIQFTLYPERLVASQINRDWRKYHDKVYQSASGRKIRQRKLLLIKEGKLILEEKK